jgi:hypothetical protein
MSNDANIFERLYKQQATIGKLVLDGARDPHTVAALLQGIIDAGAAPAVDSEKFVLLCYLGTIEIPATWSLDVFRKASEKGFYYYNPDLTEANHPTPKWAAGKRYSVRAVKQIAEGTTTSLERLEFLESQGAIYLGAQGAAMVYQEKRKLLPKSKWYTSFTEGDLARVRDGLDGGVPSVNASSDGDFGFNLGNLAKSWNQDSAFLCFCELPSDA